MTQGEADKGYRIHAEKIMSELAVELNKVGIIPHWQSSYSSFYFSPSEKIIVTVSREKEGFYDLSTAHLLVEKDYNRYGVRKQTIIYRNDKNGKINYKKAIKKILEFTKEMKEGAIRFEKNQDLLRENEELQKKEVGELSPPQGMLIKRSENGSYCVSYRASGLNVDQVQKIMRITKEIFCG